MDLLQHRDNQTGLDIPVLKMEIELPYLYAPFIQPDFLHPLFQ